MQAYSEQNHNFGYYTEYNHKIKLYLIEALAKKHFPIRFWFDATVLLHLSHHQKIVKKRRAINIKERIINHVRGNIDGRER